MLKKMDDINIYNDSAIILKRKTPKGIISWITILIILLIILTILFSIPFNKYKKINGYVINKGYLNLLVSESDFPIYKNKKLYIKEDKYDYEIVDIKDNEVILKIELSDDIKIENNIVEVNILSNRTTVFEILKNKIKKGFGL